MKWLKGSLFRKLLAVMLCVAILPFLLASVFAYRTISSSMERQVIDLNQDSMEIISNNLKIYFEDLNMLTGSFYVDPQLMKYLRSTEVSALQKLYIYNKVNTMYISRPEFHGVQYISRTKNLTFTSSDVGNNEMKKMLNDYDEIEGEATVYSVKKLGGKNILLIQKNLVDYPGATILGTLNIYVSLSEIDKVIHTQRLQDSAYFLMINEQKEFLYSSLEQATGVEPMHSKMAGIKGSFAGEMDGSKGVFIYLNNSNKTLPFTLVKYVSDSVINAPANKTLSQSIVILLIAIIFVIIFAVALSYFIILPIKRLLRNMVRVEQGNFNIQKENQRLDELGILEDRFYIMVRNLDDFMNREYRYRLELSTAQLKMLQAQINPHFLYNTMQYIGTVALKAKAYELSDKIAELGSILRYSMDFRTDVVKLSMEVKHIEDYMSIQLGRFKNKLTYSMTCHPDATSIEVPKMLLQPLIENSIVHGIEKGRGYGSIRLEIDLTQNEEAEKQILLIRVIDNGKGISAEKIEAIRNEYLEDKLHYGDNGIGLINVLQRLRLLYGSDFTWDMASVHYEATIISLTIALDKTGERNEQQ
ncbi:sensor histidine kinase [Paenibacillus woosongensis]|uniref:HAMP domain-containing protein n=1 Tax=Paenibacillus woosongensis TaxID=307580 RepID=A0A7X3CQQ4_9BACL|nr:histidine kinase [Paenibacillus woosongensis]MUG47340.1 HAMP domain-containing protein [Paenibacillus woosongensis]